MKKNELKYSSAELLEELSLTFGPSGFEGDMHEVIKGRLKDICDFECDRLGSIICRHKGSNPNSRAAKAAGKASKPTVGIFTHIDEVGFMVRGIMANGFIKFINLGGWTTQTLPSQKVLIRNAEGDYVIGVIGMKPPHMMTDDERSKAPKIDALYIDIGASSADEVVNDFKIELGSPAVPYSEFGDLNKSWLYYGKAFDNRAGVCAMLQIMLAAAGRSYEFEIAGVGSTLEESGLRGAKTSAARIKPDLAIVIDTPPADDTPNNETAFPVQGKLGCGPQIRLYDPTMIANPRFIDFIKKTVKADKLNAQYAVRSSGGTDAGSVHLSDSGVPTVVLGIPTRYIHSHTSVINVNDIDDTVRLTLRLLEKLSARTIASF